MNWSSIDHGGEGVKSEVSVGVSINVVWDVDRGVGACNGSAYGIKFF